MKLTISTAPHITSPQTTPSIMKDVIIALTPALLAAIIFFGINALIVIATSVASCVFFEYFIAKHLLKSNNTTKDYSAIITGLLLAFNLPSTIAAPIVVIGAFISIVVCKMAFGGLGKNLFNPALVGRAFLFISFPAAMTYWTVPQSFSFIQTDAQTAATTLSILKSSKDLINLPTYMDLFLGNRGGSLGETSVLAMLIGFVYLLHKRIISWHIPIIYISTVFLYCTLFYIITKDPMYLPLYQILAGGLMLGAIFMATDYTTSPMSKKGQVVFAVGCGLLTCIIRFYGSYPEGVSFAILIMNAFAPIIDKYTPQRLFGAKKWKTS